MAKIKRQKISLRERILTYLRKVYPEWKNGSEIERLAMTIGYKASNASRRCREMATGKLSDGRTCPIVLEDKIEKGTVWYRALKPKNVSIYKVEELGEVARVSNY